MVPSDSGPPSGPAVAPKPIKRSKIRAYWRFLIFFLVTGYWAVRYTLFGIFKGFNAIDGSDHGHRWSKHLARAVGMKLHVSGKVPTEPCLLVSNHQSYMDVTSIFATIPAAFMAKIEVSRWPFIGYVTRLGPTIWIDRSSEESRRASRDAIRQRVIEERVPAMVFAEGTRNSGPELLPFKPGSFSMAHEAGIPVVPIAVHYRDQDDVWAKGAHSFVAHMIRQLGKKEIHVDLVFGDPIDKPTVDETVQAAEHFVRDELARLRAEHA
ncbi:MAG: 1-acyl-sn-glycerol-3-phosphate acyltransferase [Deltaproteobacteria bacterium]|nr:1-acyl-sn-glycerol-3-phosphate acyltransferase [Deltaproteobacteria bacterium]